ncbi:MAG: beta-L-arabinofuranosidase domain-containing protein [Negativicutes bacterium]
MNKKLKKLKFEPLHISEIRPQGWLKKQLDIQLKGLSGNLDKFWPDIKDSHWFGGQAEGWERAPYWLDGVIPLAYLTCDEELIKRVDNYVDYIVTHQHEDGWLGPKAMGSALAISTQHAHYDIWGQFIALKMLVVYAESTDKEARISAVKNAIERGLRSVLNHLDRAPLFNWGQARWFECLIPIYWLYEQTEGQWLLELAYKIKAQGFDWGGFFENWPYKQRTRDKNWNYMSHVVNNTMAIKAGALWHRLSRRDTDLRSVYNQIDLLDEHHGTAVGMPSGDECLAGKDPRQGTELCSIVEYMYSLEWLLKISGDPVFADRLELLAFNPLMATFDDDMWAHQYDQQSNQIECSVREDWPWVNNRPDANTFGLEPDFGCCTANFSQGWPKYTSSLWMKENESTLVCLSYAPVEIHTKLIKLQSSKAVKPQSCKAVKPQSCKAAKDDGNSAEIKITVVTDYPHKDTVQMRVDNPERMHFTIKLRIPQWADSAVLVINGEKTGLAGGGYFHELMIIDETVEIGLKFDFSVTTNYRGEYLSVQRGPTIFALPIAAEWRRIHADWPQRELPHADWELFAQAKWNYGLENVDNACVRQLAFDEAFSSKVPTQKLSVQAREIVNWGIKNGCHGDLPKIFDLGKQTTVELVPYAQAKLRITEFPHIRN